MQCPYKVQIKDKYDVMGNPIYRPCGMCAICRRNNLMSIVTRGMFEFKKHDYNSFLTLTYDDNHLYFDNNPLGDVRVGLPSVNKKHIQKFCDDFRHYLKRHDVKNCDKDFSFLYCLEYGGETARPHAHIILFGVDFPVAKKIASKLWRNGFVDSRPVHSSSIRYVCKYINKGAKGKYSDLQYFDKGVQKPIVKWSLGFGSEYFYKNAGKIQKDGFIREGNKRVFVPSYYKNKICHYSKPWLFKQELNKQCSFVERQNLAKHYGFDSVDDMVKKFALNSIENELNKNIQNRHSVDLEEIGGFR